MVSGFRKGDKKIIGQLYDDLFPAMKNWIIRNSGTQSDAEDLFQESMLAAYKKLQDTSYKLEYELTTYIFAIAKKMWFQRLRREKVKAKYESSVLVEEKVAGLDELIGGHEIQELFREYFRKLDEECQKLLKLVFEGKAMAEICTVFNFSNESHARKKKFRCKNKLTEMIKKDRRYQELKEH